MDAQKESMENTKGNGDLEKTVKSSEAEIIEAVGTRTLVVSREDNIEFADIVWDNNPIHRDQKYARNVGLDDVLILGMLLAASSEQYALGALDKVNNHPAFNKRTFEYVGHRIRFKKFAFPGNEILWKLKGIKPMKESTKKKEHYTGFGDVIVLDIHAPKNVFNDYVTSEVVLATDRQTIPPETSARFASNTNLPSGRFDDFRIVDKPFEGADLSTIKRPLHRFYEIVGSQERKEIPPMWVAASLPALLLDVRPTSDKKSRDFFLGADFRFYGSPVPGNFRTSVIRPAKNKFEGQVYQRDLENLILYGELKVLMR